MIQIIELEKTNDLGFDWEAYGSLCRWIAYGRCYNVPVIYPPEGDSRWKSNPALRDMEAYFPEWSEPGWFAMTVRIEI